MKLNISILVGIFICIFGIILLIQDQKNTIQFFNQQADQSQEKQVDQETQSQVFCFSYNKEPTESMPYSVSEEVTLSLSEESFFGTKRGTQSGPDMTNGYSGEISGVRKGNNLEGIFTYTIEGSFGSERELYTLEQNILTKHRYSLVQDGDILMPDMQSEKQDIIYQEMACQ